MTEVNDANDGVRVQCMGHAGAWGERTSEGTHDCDEGGVCGIGEFEFEGGGGVEGDGLDRAGLDIVGEGAGAGGDDEEGVRGLSAGAGDGEREVFALGWRVVESPRVGAGEGGVEGEGEEGGKQGFGEHCWQRRRRRRERRRRRRALMMASLLVEDGEGAAGVTEMMLLFPRYLGLCFPSSLPHSSSTASRSIPPSFCSLLVLYLLTLSPSPCMFDIIP